MAILTVTCDGTFTVTAGWTPVMFFATVEVRVRKDERGLYWLEVLTCGLNRWRLVWCVSEKKVRSVRRKIAKFLAGGETNGQTLSFSKEELGDAMLEAFQKVNSGVESPRPFGGPKRIRVEVGRRDEEPYRDFPSSAQDWMS